MNSLLLILQMTVNSIFDQVSLFLACLPDILPVSGSGAALALALVVASAGNAAEGVLAGIRRWHGSIDEQFGNIDNIAQLVAAHQPIWNMPPELLAQLTGNRDQLQVLINKCRTTAGSTADRNQRNSLLKSTAGLCLLQVRVWAYGAFVDGVLTADDVHQLGFLLPGETGGSHARKEATDVKAEVKVRVVNEDFIHVVIDQSGDENAALVVHGWPPGVHNALLVITAADGKTEIFRQLTTRLHNDVQMPEGSHGKQFIIKAAFLKHVNDEPRFGNEPTFSMPLTTEDLAAALDRQHHEDFEAQLLAVEQHRKEMEELKVKS